MSAPLRPPLALRDADERVILAGRADGLTLRAIAANEGWTEARSKRAAARLDRKLRAIAADLGAKRRRLDAALAGPPAPPAAAYVETLPSGRRCWAFRPVSRAFLDVMRLERANLIIGPESIDSKANVPTSRKYMGTTTETEQKLAAATTALADARAQVDAAREQLRAASGITAESAAFERLDAAYERYRAAEYDRDVARSDFEAARRAHVRRELRREWERFEKALAEIQAASSALHAAIHRSGNLDVSELFRGPHGVDPALRLYSLAAELPARRVQ